MAKYEQVYTDDNKGLDIPSADTLNGIVSGRPMFASVDIDLQPGQKVLADGQTLLWMDGDMKMDTGCFGGGCCAAIGRKCSGESCCMNMYTGGSSIGFGFTVPGDMLSFGVTPGEGWILSQNAFIAGTQNLRVSGKFAGCWACCCGGTAGEGLFLTHVTSGESKRPGMFFAGGFGSIVRHDIPAGQVLYVDNGLFFAAHEKTKLRLALVTDRECCSCTACCSGEGIVMRFTGPAMVFTQSRDPSIFIPPKSEKDDNRNGAVST